MIVTPADGGSPAAVPPGTEYPGGTQLARSLLVPRAAQVSDNRIRPHIDRTQHLLNSAILGGYIQRDGDGVRVIGGAVVVDRDPTADDDETVGVPLGSLFANRMTHTVWFCVDNSAGSAVWVQIGG